MDVECEKSGARTEEKVIGLSAALITAAVEALIRKSEIKLCLGPIRQHPLEQGKTRPRKAAIAAELTLLSTASCVAVTSLPFASMTLPSGYSVDRAIIRQKKTGRPVRFELIDQTRMAIDEYLRLTGRKPDQFLFVGRGDRGGLTMRQYTRLVQEWVVSIGLDPVKFGTHLLRRTKAALIYRHAGNLRAVQLLLGHCKIESTVR